jgi:putative transposase
VASYVGFRFPAEIIGHAVWLCYRFALSFRDVCELMLARGVVVSHETIRQCTRKFGQTYANGARRPRPRPGDRGYPDGMVVKIKRHVRPTESSWTQGRRQLRNCGGWAGV